MIQQYIYQKYKAPLSKILSYCSYNPDYFQAVKKSDQQIITLFYKIKRQQYDKQIQLQQNIKKKYSGESDLKILQQYAIEHQYEQYKEIDQFFDNKDSVLFIEKNDNLEKLFIQFNHQLKCTTMNLLRIDKILRQSKLSDQNDENTDSIEPPKSSSTQSNQLLTKKLLNFGTVKQKQSISTDQNQFSVNKKQKSLKNNISIDSYNSFIDDFTKICKKMSIKFEQKTIQILDMLALETQPQEQDSYFNFVNLDTIMQILLLPTELEKDIILPHCIILYKVQDIKKIVFKCITKVKNEDMIYNQSLSFLQQIPKEIFKLIKELHILPQNILFRMELLKNISILSLVCQNRQLKILLVPPNLNASNYYISEFVYKHLLLNYQKQFTITSLLAQLQFLVIYKFIQQKVIQCPLNYVFKVLDSGNEAYQQIAELYSKEQPDLYYLIQVVQSPSITFLRFQKQYFNHTQQSILAMSLLKNGFLSLDNLIFETYFTYNSTYYNFMHFDTLTTIESLQEHLMILQQDREPISKIYKLIPKISSFTEPEPLSFQMKNTKFYSTLLDIQDEINVDNAQKFLILLCHEVQHLPNKVYKCTLQNDVNYLPQIISDVTSLNPLANNITFQFSEQTGIDAGGIWRQIVAQLFDNILSEVPITTADLKKMKERKKIVREVDFDRINKLMCHEGQLFKVIEDEERTLLCPIYCFYEYKSSSYVFPRVTDKRSAIYYLGRLLAYCTIYNAKIPDYFQESFYKVLVGGRFLFDDDLKQQYQQQIEQDRMFTINGTEDIYNLQNLQFTESQLRKYYSQELCVLDSMEDKDWDIDMSGLNDNILFFIKSLYGDINNYNIRKRYVQIQKQSLLKGTAFHKFFTELRLGFRHAFSIKYDQEQTVQQHYQKILQRCMDITLSQISYEELKQIIVYNEFDEEQIDSKEIAENMFSRNYQKLDYQSVYYEKEKQVLDNFVQCVQQMRYQDLITFVFASTGSRSIVNVNIEITFSDKNMDQKRYIEFHTCFNQIIVPLQYLYQLNIQQLQEYILESSQLALNSGFQMA